MAGMPIEVARFIEELEKRVADLEARIRVIELAQND
jgi:hypothetical protein